MGPSPREGMVEQVLAEELLWLGGSCKCLWKSFKNGPTGKAELDV